MHAVAREIQRARSELRLTVGEVADRSGLPTDTVWALVDGGDDDVRRLTRPQALRLVEALGRRPELTRLLETQLAVRLGSTPRPAHRVGLPPGAGPATVWR